MLRTEYHMKIVSFASLTTDEPSAASYAGVYLVPSLAVRSGFSSVSYHPSQWTFI